MTRRVVLRHSEDAGGLRHLDATVDAAGDLRIEGQDLGPGVERIFGSREYEWDWVVRAADVPALVRALGGSDGDDVLALLERLYAQPDPGTIEAFIGTGKAVPAELWSRIGD